MPGEPDIGDRFYGVSWSRAGENIGAGNGVSDTDSSITNMAVGLTLAMLAENPPNDGHKRHILTKDLTGVGLAVFRDSSGTLWMTQDFVG